MKYEFTMAVFSYSHEMSILNTQCCRFESSSKDFICLEGMAILIFATCEHLIWIVLTCNEVFLSACRHASTLIACLCIMWYMSLTQTILPWEYHIVDWIIAHIFQRIKILQLSFSSSMIGSVHPSVCPSVRPSACLSFTPSSLCSHHHIIMKFSGDITIDGGDVHAKDQGQRSRSQRSKPNLAVPGL